MGFLKNQTKEEKDITQDRFKGYPKQQDKSELDIVKEQIIQEFRKIIINKVKQNKNLLDTRIVKSCFETAYKEIEDEELKNYGL